MKTILMRHCVVGLILGFATAVSSCGSDTTAPGGGNNNTACTITLSGAATGSPACSDQTATWTSGDNVSVIGASSIGGASTLSATVTISGEPTTQTYNLSTGAHAFISVESGGARWHADGQSLGSWSLVITSVSPGPSSSSVKTYHLHGTLTATLEALSDNTSQVNLTVTF